MELFQWLPPKAHQLPPFKDSIPTSKNKFHLRQSFIWYLIPTMMSGGLRQSISISMVPTYLSLRLEFNILLILLWLSWLRIHNISFLLLRWPSSIGGGGRLQTGTRQGWKNWSKMVRYSSSMLGGVLLNRPQSTTKTSSTRWRWAWDGWNRLSTTYLMWHGMWTPLVTIHRQPPYSVKWASIFYFSEELIFKTRLFDKNKKV